MERRKKYFSSSGEDSRPGRMTTSERQCLLWRVFHVEVTKFSAVNKMQTDSIELNISLSDRINFRSEKLHITWCCDWL